MQLLYFRRGKILVPDRHGATAWKHWIFCLTDHLDFENLENRRRYHNPGKPRTAGLCGREVVASDHLPLSSTFFGWPKPPDLTHKTAALVPLPMLFSPLEIPPQKPSRQPSPTQAAHGPQPPQRPRCCSLHQSLTQPLTGGNVWPSCSRPWRSIPGALRPSTRACYYSLLRRNFCWSRPSRS